MSDELNQSEADALLAMKKSRVSNEAKKLPNIGKKLTVEVMSTDQREKFSLDINRGYISLSKLTLQTRTRVVTVLARLDIDGSPHRNPDDVEIPCPHMHLYREGYGDKWAFPVPVEYFTDLSDRWKTLQDFMRYCAIVEPPIFDRDLFS